MLQLKRTPLLIAALIVFVTSSALAQDDIRTVPVHSKPGSNSATVKGQIKGYEGVDYVVEASKDQNMNVSIATDNPSSYFNIFAPGENEAAMFIGSTSGNQFEGTLPKSGAYRIRVEESEANTLVMVGVGPNRAPWKCLAKDGVVAEVSSMTDEGAL